MWASAIVYLGAVIGASGIVLTLRPIQRLRVRTRRRGLLIGTVGGLFTAVGLFLPASESRAVQATSRLDDFAPVWHFREVHTIKVAASPSRAFDAVKRVRADEILFFHTLTWIRRGGRQLPPGILNAGDRVPLVDVATASGFIRLAEEPPRELVLGTVVVAPPGTRGALTPQAFLRPLRPGFALATINFLVTPDGPERSVISTETRVFATGAAARRRFAAYWRVIYPGSAMIRRMWLRAIERRATSHG
jgi:hypothetical protein